MTGITRARCAERQVDGTVFGLEATVLTMRRVTAGD